ncbi:MAG: hypothetical protein IIY21_05070 [Clostridiales bacterium]|nr:hypothetical protein [Clostridiales bacterium]MBQ1571123.1 hypothetical protein [Clostridiales bacterium]
MANLDQICDYLADHAKDLERIEVKLTSISGSASWSGKYYKDVDVSSYIPTGKTMLSVCLGSATNGGVDTVFLQDETTIRLLKSASFNGITQTVYLLCGTV